MSNVYLISSYINGEILYKIGMTKRSVEKRLKELKTGNAADLAIVNIFESKWASKIEANFVALRSTIELNKDALTLELGIFSNKLTSVSTKAFNCSSATNLAVAIKTSGFSEAKNPGILG